MDLLIFPSHTDTFGNVVLEALASGVPAIVTPHGGPAHILHRAASSLASPSHPTGVSSTARTFCCPSCAEAAAQTEPPGRIAADHDFAAAIADILHHPLTHATMRQTARTYAQRCSWDAVFDQVLAAYPHTPTPNPARPQAKSS
jgi:glycosyltransferase involved in cell wall biosynthesis